MAEWLLGGLDDDMRSRMFASADTGRPFALATIVDADGGPRTVGSQMVVTTDGAWGFLSGGCIEADVALHAREVLETRAARVLVYGQRSPFIDMRLPCGGRLEVLVERVAADDIALARLRELTLGRVPALWKSDGKVRRCDAANHASTAGSDLDYRRLYLPHQRLVVVGSDPFALAIAGLGTQIGWDTTLLCAFGPDAGPPVAVRCDRRPYTVVLNELTPDAWTAMAIATHDLALDQEVLAAALRSQAGYVGVLGSRRRLPERIDGLRRAGWPERQIERLHAPIGLPIGARGPWEVAVAVLGQVVALKNEADELGQLPVSPLLKVAHAG